MIVNFNKSLLSTIDRTKLCIWPGAERGIQGDIASPIYQPVTGKPININKEGRNIMLNKKVFFFILSGLLITSCTTIQPVVVEKRSDHLQQCLFYANQGDFQNAIRECKQAVQGNPYSAEAHTNLGVAYIQVGKNNKALDSLKRGVELAPHNPMAQYNLAALYSLMNQNDRSLEALDLALRNGFNNVDALRFDRDLDNVRGEPEFRTILERHKFFIQ
jgi:Tfp pilus assembly protein PilF